jgi:predicted secreted protein
MRMTARAWPRHESKSVFRVMRPLSPLATSLAAATLLGAACSASREGTVQVGTARQVSSPSEPLPSAPRAGQWPTDVQARVGQPVIIRLPGTAGTGYTWQLSSPVCDNLPLAFSQQIGSSTDGRVGGPAEWIFTFTPERAGSCALSFQYHRPWERGVAPAETRSVTVTVVAP